MARNSTDLGRSTSDCRNGRIRLIEHCRAKQIHRPADYMLLGVCLSNTPAQANPFHDRMSEVAYVNTSPPSCSWTHIYPSVPFDQLYAVRFLLHAPEHAPEHTPEQCSVRASMSLGLCLSDVQLARYRRCHWTANPCRVGQCSCSDTIL